MSVRSSPWPSGSPAKSEGIQGSFDRERPHCSSNAPYSAVSDASSKQFELDMRTAKELSQREQGRGSYNDDEHKKLVAIIRNNHRQGFVGETEDQLNLSNIFDYNNNNLH